MAKLKICAVFDSAMQAHNRPMFVPAVGLAVRSFTDEVNRAPQPGQENPLFSHPDDFELRYLGEYDEEYGNFTVEPGEGGRVLARAKDVKRNE